MPELPEVETIVRELRPEITGKKIWKVESKLDSMFKPSFDFFRSHLPGTRVLDVRRRGKYIVIVLSNSLRLVIHLRMTGRLMWHKQTGREKYLCAAIHFSDATTLYYSDVRKFGKLWLFGDKHYEKGTGIIKLGKEPLHQEMGFDEFYRVFAGRKGILKNSLLRQDLIAGIGNIYADEICFRAGFLPGRRLEKISKQGWKKIYDAMKFCLNEGIKHCGVSVSDFVGTRGKTGKHQHYLKVYGRKGEQCHKCGSAISKTRMAGRGTFYCEKCQK